jgi:Flp pilus assembly pilin Flp
MTSTFKTFAADESGAVTVDWVVLTAALVGLGLAVMGVVRGGIADLTGDINTQLQAQQVDTTFETDELGNGAGGVGPIPE